MNAIKNAKIYIIILAIVLAFTQSKAEIKIAFVEMDSLINESLVGKSMIQQLDKLNKENVKKFSEKRKKLSSEKNKIQSQKNILSNEEYVKKVNIFKKDLTNYQNEKKEIIRNFNIKQNNEIMRFIKLISPLINEYMDKNSISILIEKKKIYLLQSQIMT